MDIVIFNGIRVEKDEYPLLKISRAGVLVEQMAFDIAINVELG